MSINPKNSKNNSSDNCLVRNLYHTSGDLRNAQLFLVSLSNDKVRAPDLLLWLATYIAQHQQDWNELYGGKVFKQLRKRLLKATMKKPGVNALRLFFQEKTN